MDDEIRKIWKKGAQHMSEGTEEYHGKSQKGQAIPQPELKQSIS
jgi:hypothetical protein